VLSSRVYSNFSRFDHINNDVEIVGGETIYIGMDFNINPMSAVIAVKRDDNFYIVNELEIMSSNTSELCSALYSKYGRYENEQGKLCKREVVVCPDPSGNRRQHASGGTDFKIIKEAGFLIHAPKGAPRGTDNITNAQTNLLNAAGEIHVYVHSRCKKLIKALEGFTYKKDTNIPNKTSGLDHITDAFKYLLWQEANKFKTKSGPLNWIF